MTSDMATIRLITKGCPDPFCEAPKNSIIYWTHTCGSNSKLDKFANIHCFRCNAKYSILNARFKCSYWKNLYEPNYSRLVLILGALGTITQEDYNSSISQDLSYWEFNQFIESVVDHLSIIQYLNGILIQKLIIFYILKMY